MTIGGGPCVSWFMVDGKHVMCDLAAEHERWGRPKHAALVGPLRRGAGRQRLVEWTDEEAVAGPERKGADE